MIFSAIALICALSIPPSDCTPDTATAVISLPNGCAQAGQPTIAGSAVKPGDGYYLLVVCEGR